MIPVSFRSSTLLLLGLFAFQGTSTAQIVGTSQGDYRFCDTEPFEVPPSPEGAAGGGMLGNGWDGPGQNPITVFWYVEGITADIDGPQRTAMINAMQAWAGVVRITFVEIAVPNLDKSIDMNFLTDDHAGSEPQESGDPDCPFDGGGGVLAHAGFPPGVSSQCSGNMRETFAGNVHFDDAELWAQDAGPGYSLTHIAAHEIGHAIGLKHSNGSTDVMRATVSVAQAFAGLSSNDITNIRSGYATGTGAVVSLEDSGVWVDLNFFGLEYGIPGAPVNTVLEGVNGVPPFTSGVEVQIAPGHYAEGALVVDWDLEMHSTVIGASVVVN